MPRSAQGGSVAAAADRFDVSRAVIYLWRKQVRAGLMPGVTLNEAGAAAFAPVAVVADVPAHVAPQVRVMLHSPIKSMGYPVEWSLFRLALLDFSCFSDQLTISDNEVGTIQPIAEVSRIARAHRILLHTDAAQSVGKIVTDVNTTTGRVHRVCRRTRRPR